MKTSLTLLTALAFAASVHATVTIEYVTVGNAGNAADPLTGGLYGAVSYSYQIGKYEVTNAQYVEFLNAKAKSDPNGLYTSGMTSDLRGGINRSGTDGSYTYSVKTNFGNKPVGHVSIADAMRFTNWINNGQGAATTESGVYDMSFSATTVTRSSGANVFLPTENEWYKAAYYQPVGAGGDTDSYWLYATQSNTVPTAGTADAAGNITNPGANVATRNGQAIWNGGANITTVGSAGATSDSYYGTYDMTGNAWEWNEAIISGGSRGLRGGGFLDASPSSNERPTWASHNVEVGGIGFRLAAVPEPSRMMLTLAGACGLLLRRRRLPSAL